MKTSPYFHQLRAAYQAELDDLAQDSEGRNILSQRLQQKRKEMPFLVQMMAFSPEMVAVVFHQGFRFSQPAVMEKLLAQPEGRIPDWHAIKVAITLEPWAQALADIVLQEEDGAAFLAVAAGLEFALQQDRSAHNHVDASADENSQEEDTDASDDDLQDDDFNPMDADDARDPQSSRSRQEAAADWMSDMGFDRKE